jgi:hypothetical protein
MYQEHPPSTVTAPTMTVPRDARGLKDERSFKCRLELDDFLWQGPTGHPAVPGECVPAEINIDFIC